MCRTAAAPREPGSALTSANEANQTPTFLSEPTLKRRRHSSSRGPRTLSSSGRKAGSASANGPVKSRPVSPNSSPISVLAASPSSETSSGMVSSWPSTKTSPVVPGWSRNPVAMPSSVAQSPPYTMGKRPSRRAFPTRLFNDAVIANNAGSLIKLVTAPRPVSAGGRSVTSSTVSR